MNDESLASSKPQIVDMPARMSDQDRADEIRRMIAESLAPVIAAMNYAQANGFTVGWNLGLGPTGRNQLLGPISIMRHF